jgi:hypothetical protein
VAAVIALRISLLTGYAGSGHNSYSGCIDQSY